MPRGAGHAAQGASPRGWGPRLRIRNRASWFCRGPRAAEQRRCGRAAMATLAAVATTCVRGVPSRPTAKPPAPLPGAVVECRLAAAARQAGSGCTLAQAGCTGRRPGTSAAAACRSSPCRHYPAGDHEGPAAESTPARRHRVQQARARRAQAHPHHMPTEACIKDFSWPSAAADGSSQSRRSRAVWHTHPTHTHLNTHTHTHAHIIVRRPRSLRRAGACNTQHIPECVSRQHHGTSPV
jgi:hypothetical protein